MQFREIFCRKICIIQLKSVIFQREKVLKSVKAYVLLQDLGIFGGVSAFFSLFFFRNFMRIPCKVKIFFACFKKRVVFLLHNSKKSCTFARKFACDEH